MLTAKTVLYVALLARRRLWRGNTVRTSIGLLYLTCSGHTHLNFAATQKFHQELAC